MELFGVLITLQENTGSVSPRNFKQQIASFNSSFAGYGQHDSQVPFMFNALDLMRSNSAIENL